MPAPTPVVELLDGAAAAQLARVPPPPARVAAAPPAPPVAWRVCPSWPPAGRHGAAPSMTCFWPSVLWWWCRCGRRAGQGRAVPLHRNTQPHAYIVPTCLVPPPRHHVVSSVEILSTITCAILQSPSSTVSIMPATPTPPHASAPPRSTAPVAGAHAAMGAAAAPGAVAAAGLDGPRWPHGAGPAVGLGSGSVRHICAGEKRGGWLGGEAGNS